MFNYEIKYESYQIALKNAKEKLKNNDINEGKYYLKKAIELSNELIEYSIISEIKSRLCEENNKLKEILKKIEEDKCNPFIEKKEKNIYNYTQDNTLSKETYFKSETPKVKLEDVVGLNKVKEEIRLNVIAPLNNPEIYFKYKDDIGCRILLYGPPGCGKTFIAEAIAGELKCAYAIINASDILDKYVGEAPKKIAQIFKESEKYDRCLIFFDELEALFSSRENEDSRYTRDVLTTFLTCLSGFDTKSNDKLRIVIGATNRPWALDSALLRGKRFDTLIYVGLPDKKSREFLVKKAFKNRQNLIKNANISIEELVDLFEGYSCADIESMIDKMKTMALSRALKNNKLNITEDEPITKEDAQKVAAGYRNSVSKDYLEMFKMFEDGVI